MKKFLAFVAVLVLAACSRSYDYYQGNVRYVQDGNDCIYSSGEIANNYSSEVDTADLAKQIVYRNTSCAELYARDMEGQEVRQERRVLTPAATETYDFEPVAEPRKIVKPMPVKKSCKCCAKKTTKKYVVVSGM